MSLHDQLLADLEDLDGALESVCPPSSPPLPEAHCTLRRILLTHTKRAHPPAARPRVIPLSGDSPRA